jgi:6-phosphogluconate dehydrogenase
MGQNLVLNLAGHGFKVAVSNRTIATGRQFLKERAQGLPIALCEKIPAFIALLKKPRTVMLMVQAGPAVDEMIAQLVPLLAPGDLIADCGNSYFGDTERRAKALAAKGIEFMGVGVSGGEEGALHGPSIMAGGSSGAYERVRPILEAIAARTADGPCVTHVGPRGAGHFVKMVHNGLEYGDMQLIAETYSILERVGKLDAPALARAFEEYNRGELASYLLEITARIFQEQDPDTGRPLVEVILDTAGQKGTGRWTSEVALQLAEPTPTITAAVEARNLSAKKELRLAAEKILWANKRKDLPVLPAKNLIRLTGHALYAAKLSLYAQGMALLAAASREYGYGLNLPELARIWKGGCIIRAELLDVIRAAFAESADLPNLLLDPKVADAILSRHQSWSKVCQLAVAYSIPCPALSSALAYFEALRSGRLPANLIQAQRDLFGAHTFERVDRKGSFHHRWKG